jgi:predicted O-methyltransferase YrrM
VGNGAGKLHPASSRVLADGHQADDSPKNLNSYRITDDDRLGEGGPKQKFSQNLKAIEILRALDAENRPASPDEKALLVKYVGWGAMPQVFDVDSTTWHREQIQLSEILSDEEHRSARATTLNAHYTAPVVIRSMYEAAQRFGFKGGQILEPASGIGHFIGLMPEAMLKNSAITGIEIDPLTARIAKALYPDADIREQPFEKSKLLDDAFDLAISNVPFGDYTVHDPRWNDFKFPIHDYFFAAALDKVRPGGLLMFVTSRHTLDKLDSTLRETLSSKTEFLAAIRLPNTAFKKNAGTEVTTDIVMLRKLRVGESPPGPAWKTAADFTNDRQEKFPINEYFAAHPEMMLGKMRLARGMYRDGEPVLLPDDRDLGEALAQAVARLPQNIYEVQTESAAEKFFDPAIPAPDYIKPNAYCVHEDDVQTAQMLNLARPKLEGEKPASRSVTTACRPLNPLRISHASTATNTFRLPEKLNMAFAAHAPGPPPVRPVSSPQSQRAPRRATPAPAPVDLARRGFAPVPPPLPASAIALAS